MQFKRVLPALASAVALCCPAWVVAQNHPTPDGTYVVQVKPAPKPVSKPGPTVKPGKPDYSNEPFVIEHSLTSYRYNADGTGDRTLSATVQIQSDAAVRAYGLLAFYYASDDESVEVKYVRVLQPDGTTIATEPSAAEDQPSEVTREAPLYSDQRQLQIPVRGLAVGDRLSWQVVVHVHKADAPGAFWGEINFEPTAVALDEQVGLSFPAGLPVTVLSPLYPPKKTTSNGETLYIWHTVQLKPSVTTAKREDVKAKTMPDLAWTTYRGWDKVGEWYRNLQQERAAPDATIEAKAAALVAGATTPAEKLERIYSFVSMQIRYIGVDFGVGRYQPHTADQVLSNGYGDCKDKHTLLAALLTTQGFHVDPVLIGAGITIDKDLPAPSNFNHVITAVEEPGGKRLWLDSTEEVAPPGMLVSVLRDKDALLIPTDGKSPSLVKTPAGLPFQGFDTYNSQAVLTKDGKLTAHFEVTMHSDLELLCRGLLFAQGRAQWEQIGQNISSGMGFGGTVTEFAPVGVDSLAAPLHYTYDYERSPYGDWDNHRILSLLPYALFAGTTLTKQPDDPIDVGPPRTETATSSITLPAGWTAPTLPDAVHAKSSFATFDLTYSLHGNVLTTEARMQVLAYKVPPAKWEEYNAFTKDITDSEQFVAVAEATPGSVTGDAQNPALASGSTPKGVDVASQAVIADAMADLRRQDLPAVKAKLAKLQASSPDARGVWFLAGVVAGADRQWPAAETDIRKEMALYPDEKDKTLPTLLWAQHAENHPADEIVTLDALRAVYPDALGYVQAEGQLMSGSGRTEDGLALLEAAALRHPHDRATLFALANVQFSASRPEEARVAMELALDGASDPLTLNNGAYQLVDHDVDLPLAKADTVKALAALDAETQKAKLDSLTRSDLGEQTLLAATWDTMAWIDYKNGDTAGAEDLLHAAYAAMQSPDVGYHLGMVYEKEGKPQDALRCYELAASGLTKPAKDVAAELKARTDALKAKGIHDDLQQPADTLLAKERMLNLPLLVDKPGEADYFLLASGGKVSAMQAVSGDDALRGQGPKLQAALDKNHSALLWPKGSGATLLRRGILSCSPVTNSCQFVLFLLQDTSLPNQKLQITVADQGAGKH
jgi:tetratricopeptide (TPR) repeat protein